MTPDLTLTPLLDKEHLEKEKNVPAPWLAP